MGLIEDLKKGLAFRGHKEESDAGKSPSWDRPHRNISLRLVVLGIIGLVIFILANFFGQGAKQVFDGPSAQFPQGAVVTETSPPPGVPTTLNEYEQGLSTRLALVLEQVHGAGEVLVYIGLVSGPEYDYARNEWVESRTTEERDAGGGQRIIEEVRQESQLVMAAGNQGVREGGMVQKEMHPPIQGVLIIATGAENSRVKAELVRAAQVVLGIGSHQVVVLPKER